MMPNPYAILAALGIGIALMIGAFFYGQHVEGLEWKAAYAAQQEVANTMLNNAYQEKSDRERLDADKSRKVDEEHAQELASAAAGRDDFARKLRIAISRKSGCPASGGQAPDSGVGQNAASVSDDGSGTMDTGLRLRDAVVELQAYARACHSWALTVGR